MKGLFVGFSLVDSQQMLMFEALENFNLDLKPVYQKLLRCQTLRSL